MIYHRKLTIVAISLLVAELARVQPMPTFGQATGAENLQAGVAVADITPPVPFRMSGYFNERLSTGVKDPLQAKAIVFRQGDESAALVFCDLIGVPAEVSSRARRLTAAATGIPAEHIVIAATHSHTGPLYFGSLHHHFRESAIARFGKDPHDSQDYVTQLAESIAVAVVKAKAALRPVRIEAGYATEERLSFNRRFFMKDGSVRFNPGQKNPDIVRAAGPIDPQVGTILIKPLDESTPLAAIVSFALHLDTVSGTEYSADYPKTAEAELRKSFGPEFTLLFGAGTCGDINHIDVTRSDKRTSAEIGTMLAETIADAAERDRFESIDAPSLAVRSAQVDVPLQTYSQAEIALARENMNRIGSRELPFLDQVKACTIMDLQQRGTEKIPLEVHAIRLGRDAAIVTLPGEVFVELGLAIKAASPFKTTLVIELTNDSPAYIPTKKAFAEGSYEIVNSRIEPGGGEKMVETAIGLLKELE
jgi:neutral ceramidase